MKTALQKAREAPSSTKARILAAAEQVFAAKGFDGASTREIAGQAGVNISSLHYHWESKDTLYLAVVQDIHDRIMQLARDAIDPTKEKDAAKIVENALGHLIDFFMDHPTIPRLLLRRVLESADTTQAVDDHMLSPGFMAFTGFMRDIGLPVTKKLDAQLFMLSVHSVLLLFTLDSQAYQNLLGDRLTNPTLRKAVRKHIIQSTLRELGLGE